jgi:hypothetical protein
MTTFKHIEILGLISNYYYFPKIYPAIYRGGFKVEWSRGN